MGICYKVLICDEFDWNYVGFDRDTVSKQVLEIIPHAILKADIKNMMVFDIDKSIPSSLLGKVTCDSIYHQDDGNGYALIHDTKHNKPLNLKHV